MLVPKWNYIKSKKLNIKIQDNNCIFEMNASLYVERNILHSKKPFFRKNSSTTCHLKDQLILTQFLIGIWLNYYKNDKLQLHNNFFNFNKNIYLIGGSGLIGSIVSDLINYNAKVVNVDITKHTKKYVNYHKNYEYVNYDISNHDFENSYLIKIFKKYGDPDVLINCSYPRDELWTKSNFQQIDNKSFKNIDLHLCSYSFVQQKKLLTI